MKRTTLAVCGLLLVLLLAACGSTSGEEAAGGHTFDYGGSVTLRILSGSENQELEGILEDFAENGA